MKKSEMILPILRSYVQNFPVLRSWGKSVNDCITLKMSSRSQIKDVIRSFCQYPVIVTSTDGVPATNAKIRSPNAQAAFLWITQKNGGKFSEKEIAKINLFRESTTTGLLDGKMLEFPLFFILEGVVPEILADTYIVNFPDEKFTFERDYYEKIPSSQELLGIRNYIDQQELCESQRPMVAAAAFLKSYYDKNNLQSEFSNIRNFAETILEEFVSTEEICEFFCDMMFRKAQEGFLDNVIYLPKLKNVGSKTFEDSIFSDMRGNIFMTDRKFSEICREILEEVSITQLKAALKVEEILVSFGNGYTSKMSYQTENGEKKRATMIRLDADKIVNAFGYKLSYKLTMKR